MIRTTGIESRRAALRILEQVREGTAFDAALDQGVESLPEPDRRLAHELAAGVLRQRKALDQRLALLVPRGWRRVAPDLKDILRLGAYQLTMLERVPAHAAVDTSVALAKDTAGVRASGFVNAVLRRLVRTGPAAVTASKRDAAGLALEYSHPLWLVQRWLESFGLEDTEQLLRWNNSRPRLVVQPARADLETLEARWRAEGIEVEPAPFDAGLIPNRSRPAELPGYHNGRFIAQDPAQALLVRFAGVPAGAVVYDACAAPGGKTIALGRCSGLIVAGDVSVARVRRLAENVARAGSGREYVVVADGRHPPVHPLEAVLLDAPCLATGSFARHPDARWRVTPGALAKLVRLQAELLEGTAAVVSPGGLLVYSTCSLEPEENERQVDRFLAGHPQFRREPEHTFSSVLLSTQGDLVILPHRHGVDGAYAARLRRSA